MKRAGLAGLTLLSLLISTPAALGQSQCEGVGQPTVATCGNDQCACSGECTENSQCVSGCCSNGFCALQCVCDGEGTVTLDCATNGGCGNVAPASPPLGGAASWWGFGLLGLGLVAAGRFIRKSGARSAAAVASLSLALLGATFVAASAFQKAPIAQSKARVDGR